MTEERIKIIRDKLEKISILIKKNNKVRSRITMVSTPDLTKHDSKVEYDFLKILVEELTNCEYSKNEKPKSKSKYIR